MESHREVNEEEIPSIREEPTEAEPPRGWQPSAETAEAISGAESDSSTLTPQDQQAVESMKEVQGIRPDAWEGLNEDERLAALQEVEDRMAATQGRPSAEVVEYEAGPGNFGHYDPETNQIGVGSYSLENDDVNTVTDTVIHEGRHAYQHYAVEHPEVHPKPEEVQAWRDNMPEYGGTYITFDEDPEDYREQPVEADAWEYGNRISRRLYGGVG